MPTLKKFIDTFNSRFIKPLSDDEDIMRREYIFNLLVISVIVLTVTGLIITSINQITQGHDYDGTPPLMILVALIMLTSLYVSGRRKFRNTSPYIFVVIFFLLATSGLYQYGYVLPPAILMYMLVIVMASVLISVKASLILAVIVVMTLVSIAYAQITGIVQPGLDEHKDPLDVANLAIFIVMLGIVLLVSALSNIEIERSLKRARQSEKELRKERDQLEAKVAKRTRELERSQVEKTLELYRFAEFGRLSSTMLHDIANPLTAVSLNLDQLAGQKKTKIFEQLREGITHMEQYVHSARLQLRNESELRVFDSCPEIKRVQGLLLAKARNQRVTLDIKSAKGAYLYGDSLKFDQIIANLLANALDAYSTETGRRFKVIKLHSKIIGKRLVINVKDNGSGISENEISHIFEPFFTTKASTRGTGIGLTIIKQIIEKDFGGSIHVNSSENKGTNFIVTLPLHEP